MKRWLFFIGIFSLIIVAIFRNWFTPTLLTGGDWVYYTPTMVRDATFLAGWDDRYSGMGNNKIVKLPLEAYFIGTMKLTQGIDWRWYERIFWFFPFLLLSITSSFFLTKKVVKKTPFCLLGSLLYTVNTYSLMLIGGGQNGVALAYACLPFLLLSYINLLENSDSLFFSLLFTLSLSVVTLFDVRIVYVGLPILAVISILYFLFFFPKDRLVKRFFCLLIIPGIGTFGLHAFWMLPLLLNRSSAVSQFGEVYTGVDSVKFFSFAFLENTLGLLHPNWPDNIFGKVTFMRPEFLLYPLLAFGSLFVFKPFGLLVSLKEKRQQIYIVAFIVIGLMGVFLAKGANDPFGIMYLWFFNHIPGFVLFRDPTKWYMLIAVSYSVLIPCTMDYIYTLLQTKITFPLNPKIFNLQNMSLLIVTCFVLFTIRQSIFGQLGGTFKPHVLPQDYQQLERYFSSQKSFSRSLWIPNFQRFSSFTSLHPEIPAQDYYSVASISGVIDNLKKENAEEHLEDAAIKYIVVPDDSEGELFLTDRKYDERIFQKTVASISALPYLSEIPGFAKIHVFEVPNAKDHLWTTSSAQISYTQISPTEFNLRITNAVKGNTIIFSESYDKGWKASLPNIIITSKPFEKSLNSFILPQNGSYTLHVYYQPQEWVTVGAWISLVVGIFFLIISIFSAYSWFGKHKMIE